MKKPDLKSFRKDLEKLYKNPGEWDQKYPSQNVIEKFKPAFEKLGNFVEWIEWYVEDRVKYIEGLIATLRSDMNSRFGTMQGDLDSTAGAAKAAASSANKANSANKSTSSKVASNKKKINSNSKKIGSIQDEIEKLTNRIKKLEG